MPSRRSPVTIARAVGSKSSTTSTLMTALVPSAAYWPVLSACQAAGISQVSAAGAVLIPAPAYNHDHGNDNRGRRAAQAVRPRARAGRDDVHRLSRSGHRLHRPERGGEIHHDAGDGTDQRPGRVPPCRCGRGRAMTTAVPPYRSGQPAGLVGFAQLLRAEVTKFRTVRAWMIALCSAA